MTHQHAGRQRTWAAVVVAVGVAFILLLPFGSVPSAIVQGVAGVFRALGAPHWLADQYLWERVLNVVLFVPVGAVLALLLPRWHVLGITLLGAGASLTFEAVQAFLMAGRDGSLFDVATNTLGTAIGAGLVALSRRRVT